MGQPTPPTRRARFAGGPTSPLRGEAKLPLIPTRRDVNWLSGRAVGDQQLERVDESRAGAVEVRRPIEHNDVARADGLDVRKHQLGFNLRPSLVEPAGRQHKE